MTVSMSALDAPITGNSIEDRNLQVVKDAYACTARGDLHGFTASFTADTEIHEAASLPYGGVHKGVDSFPTLIGKVQEHFSGLKFTKHRIVASEDNVILWGVLELTSKKTGKPVAIRMVEIWTIVDGKTRKLDVIYGDTAAVLKAADLG
jgi:ketosteroid isomerase-like protein